VVTKDRKIILHAHASIAFNVRPRSRSSLYAGMMKETDAISLTP